MIVNPVGIDKPIQELQILFQNKLWLNVIDSKKQFNHRVFRNEHKGEVFPEVFIDSTNDYRRVLFNDKLTVLSWFDVSEIQSDYVPGQNIKEVGIFFAVNLKELYPTLAHRAIEESHIDVTKIIQMHPNFIMPFNEILEAPRAYGDFDNNLRGYDQQPWHVFRINCNVIYNVKC